MIEMNEERLREIAKRWCSGPKREQGCDCGVCVSRFAAERIDEEKNVNDQLTGQIDTLRAERDDLLTGIAQAGYQRDDALKQSARVRERRDALRDRIERLERAIHTIHEKADDNEDGAIDAHYAAKAMTRVKATCIDVMPARAFEAPR